MRAHAAGDAPARSLESTGAQKEVPERNGTKGEE
jgi:hypothetical protein